MVTGPLLALAVMTSAPAQPSQTPSLRDTVEMAALSGVSISPDEHWVVYREERASIAENRRRLSWWATPADGSGPARKIADGGEPIWTDAGPAPSETPQWSPDGVWFYFRAVTEAGLQVWRADPNRSVVEQVTHDPADVEAYVVGRSGLAWRVGPTREKVQQAEREEYDQGVRIDGSVDPAQNLFEAVNVNGRFAAQRLVGQWFARRKVVTAAPEFRHADFAGDTVETLTAPAAEALGLPAAERLPPLFSNLADLSADSPYGHLTVQRSRTDGVTLTVRRAAMDLPIVCKDPLCAGKISAVGWRPGQETVIFTRNEPGYSQGLFSWQVGRGRVRAIAATDGLIGGGLTDSTPCAFSKARAFCVVAAPNTPPRLEAVDLDSGARSVLAAPNGSLAVLGPSKPQRLAWQDTAGHAFTGVFIPAAESARTARPPLFLTYYSCEGFVPGGVGDEWPLRALASAGIAALCVNKTGSGAAKQDSVADYQIALSGIRSIIDRLDAQGAIDRDRIGMGGLSFGSETTMFVATESDLLKAVSISTPQLEPTYYWTHGVAGRDNHGPFKTAWGLEAPETTPERWKIVSPAFKADRIRAAVLMQMVEQEYRVGPELLARLSNSNTPVEAYVFAQEPHIKVQPRHKLAVYQRNLDWFQFWLKDVEDPDPAKAAQYARWRALRARAHRAP